MKILVLSDIHFGYGKNTEIENDPFEYVRQALKEDVDAILLGGDIFDTKVPNTEIFVRAFRLFLSKKFEPDKIEVIKGIDKDVDSLPALSRKGIPIVGIHGTHERRIKGLLNPIQAMERMGVLIHIHSNGVILERGEEKICIQGLSGVPDQFAEIILDNWKPKPVDNCFNIFLLHQSVEGFVISNHLLPKEKIPKGFDMYILGHIHTPEKTSYSESPLIVTGSVIPTQIKKEYINPTGYWIIDTKNPDPEFIEFKNQRKAFIVEGAKEEVSEKIEKILSDSHAKKPIIRVISDENIRKEINIKFGERAIIHFSKKGIEESIRESFTMEEHRLSVQELGKKLLMDNLKKAGLDQKSFEEVFELFAEKRPEEAIEKLRDNPEKSKDGLDKWMKD